ncbi:hypothetical protein B5S32_g2276 [[Candida] boidinii]|nr:hypothetical protein B5S32_g2276 [[Candida] boidinii]
MTSERTPLLTPVKSHAHDELPSLNKRYLQIGCSIAWCLFAAGPVFGFAALKPVLISQGVYHEYCKIDDIAINTKGDICVAQDLKLNSMFTYAAVITNATALLVGNILDNYGPKVTAIIGSFILFIAALLLRSAKEIELFDSYLAGYVLLAFGGPFVFISCFQLSNSFPANSGLILALLTGAFDSSSALFLIYRIIYQNNYINDLNLKKFFSFYLIVPIFILICQLTIMPSESYKTINTIAKIGAEGIDETGEPIDPNDERYNSEEIQEVQRVRSRRSSVQSAKSVFEEIADKQLTNKSGGVFGVLHDFSMSEQMSTPWFYLMALFTTVQMLRINYFVATIKSQELFLFKSEKIAVEINKFFDLALPIGGLFSIPMIGLLLDNFTTLTVLTILLIISLFIGIMGVLSVQFFAYLGIILLVLYRPFYYTAVSDYCTKVFGFKTFGTVYGSIIAFSGLCNVFQTILDNLTHQTFNMNPIPVNLFLTILTAIFGFGIIWFIKRQELEIQKRKLIEEANNAEVFPIPQ